jgi:hypothetical protein
MNTTAHKGQYGRPANPDYVVHLYAFYGIPNPEQAVGGAGQGGSGQQQGSGPAVSTLSHNHSRNKSNHNGYKKKRTSGIARAL